MISQALVISSDGFFLEENQIITIGGNENHG